MTREAVEQRDQEDAGCKSPGSPVLCTNGCGHFGSATTMNLCCKCYAEYGQPILKSKPGAGRELPTLSLAAVENLEQKLEQKLERSEAESAGQTSSLEEEEVRHAERLSHTSTAGNLVEVSLTGVGQIDEIQNGSRAGKGSETSSQLAEEQSNKFHRNSDQDGVFSSPVQTGKVLLSLEVRSNRNISIEKRNPVAVAKVEQDQSPDISVATRVQAEKRPPPRNLCQSCRKRIGLTGFKCRCGNMYCAIHRYSDKHSCTYDYKLAGREVIAKANPLMVASKVIRI